MQNTVGKMGLLNSGKYGNISNNTSFDCRPDPSPLHHTTVRFGL